jgi:4-amino-4-deoxy-L-arabinose transferase-like glycosyltransferase
LFSDAVGGQIAWMLPLAVMGVIAASWCYRRDRSRRGAIVMWAGWLALYAVVFSMAKGTFHSYYTSVMTPALAALVGIGAAALVTLIRRDRRWLALLGAGAFATVALQLGLAGRHPGFYGWVRLPMIGLGLVALGVLIFGIMARRGRVVLGALAWAMAASLVLPAAWALSETANPVLNATLPQAGARTGTAGSTFGSASWNGDAALAAYLVGQRSGQRWDLVVGNAQTGSGLIAYQDLSVLAIGGFMGTDRSTTVSDFADLVAAGEVRFVLVSSSGFAGGGRGFSGGAGGASGGVASSILSAVQQTCPAVTSVSTTSGTIYDCAGQAEAIRAAA